MIIDVLDRSVEIDFADNGYVLKYSGYIVNVDDDGYENKEYVRSVEVYEYMSSVYDRLLELDQLEIDQ